MRDAALVSFRVSLAMIIALQLTATALAEEMIWEDPPDGEEVESELFEPCVEEIEFELGAWPEEPAEGLTLEPEDAGPAQIEAGNPEPQVSEDQAPEPQAPEDAEPPGEPPPEIPPEPTGKAEDEAPPDDGGGAILPQFPQEEPEDAPVEAEEPDDEAGPPEDDGFGDGGWVAKTAKARGEGFIVTVRYNRESGIPADAVLTVSGAEGGSQYGDSFADAAKDGGDYGFYLLDVSLISDGVDYASTYRYEVEVILDESMQAEAEDVQAMQIQGGEAKMLDAIAKRGANDNVERITFQAESGN